MINSDNSNYYTANIADLHTLYHDLLSPMQLVYAERCIHP